MSEEKNLEETEIENTEKEELSTFEHEGKTYGGTSLNEENSTEMPEGEVLCQVDYNVKLAEEEKAFKLFQKLYVRKSCIIRTIIFGLVFAVFFVQFMSNKSDYISIIAMTIAAMAIFVTWYNPVSIRKGLMKALAPLENDSYIFKLYGDAFTIETVIDESEFLEDEERIYPPPRVVWFEKSDFEVHELDDMFVIIMKKETIYVLPKRCMDEQKAEVIRSQLVKAEK